jgi:hypothetical protein
MKRYAIATALGCAALGLTACNEPARTGGNAKICADFKTAKAPSAVPGAPGSDAAARVDECVKRWAYSLASSPDDAAVVAEATKAACGTQLANWNQQIVNQPGADGESASILTGEPTTPLAEHNAFAERRALFYVVQARAGKCAAPPAKDGVPEGVG